MLEVARCLPLAFFDIALPGGPPVEFVAVVLDVMSRCIHLFFQAWYACRLFSIIKFW